MINEADKTALIRQNDVTLAEWYCALNRWEWPADLPDPEEPYLKNAYMRTRRGAIMEWISEMVGDRLCSRMWNKGMTDAEHNDFWAARMERDEEAQKRYDLYLDRKLRERNK